jgi:hypothetical protein
MFEEAATCNVTGMLTGLFETPEVTTTVPVYVPGWNDPMLTARTLNVAGVEPWAGVTVNQGVAVVTVKGTGVVPVDSVTGWSPLFWAVYATEKLIEEGVAIIVTGATVVLTITVKFFVSVLPQVSDARSAKLKVPSVVGVPLIITDVPEGAQFNPGGNVPEASAQLTPPPPNGFVLHAPVAFTGCWYAAPILAFGSEAVVMAKVPGTAPEAIGIVKGWDADAPVTSVTVMVKEKVPAVVGTPVTEPFVGPSPRPGGNVPVAVHENGATPPEMPMFNK